VPSESAALQGLAAANKELIIDLQCRKPARIATLNIDIDATVIHSSKRSAKRAYDGERGYQPVLVLWAEQDVIVADEFRERQLARRHGQPARHSEGGRDAAWKVR
jgi:hypothetical protein